MVYTLLVYKNTVYKNTEGEIWYHLFKKKGNIRPLQKKSMSNETASQEKQFKHTFRGRGD